MENIIKLLGAKHSTTTSYNPQANGLTERMNKTLATAMSHYVSLDHRDWDQQVPLITFAINTALQDTTRYTPFELFYGRPPLNRIEIALNHDGCDFTNDPNEYVRQMEN